MWSDIYLEIELLTPIGTNSSTNVAVYIYMILTIWPVKVSHYVDPVKGAQRTQYPLTHSTLPYRRTSVPTNSPRSSAKSRTSQRCGIDDDMHHHRMIRVTLRMMRL